MTPETLDKWKILPRAMMVVITVMSYRVAEWYMSLPDPTIEQSGFCSIIIGCLTDRLQYGWERRPKVND